MAVTINKETGLTEKTLEQGSGFNDPTNYNQSGKYTGNLLVDRYDKRFDTGVAPADTSQLDQSSLAPEPSVDLQTYEEPAPFDASKMDVPELELTDPEKEQVGLEDEIASLTEGLLGESDYRSKQEELAGLTGNDGLFATQRDLQSQLKAIQAEAKALPLQMQEMATGRGITKGGLAPLQASALRKNAIQALSTSALLEASRGNIATAQDQVDRAVAQKYDPIKERIAVNKANLQMLIDSPRTSIADKNRAKKQMEMENEKEKQAKEREAEDKSINNLAIQAAQSGIEGDLLNSIKNADTLLEATKLAQKAGFYKVGKDGLMEVSPGSSLFDPNTGQFIGTAPSKPLNPKDMMQVVGDSLLEYNPATGTWNTVFTKPKDATVDDPSVNEKLNLKEKGYEMDASGNLVKVSATPQEKIDKATKVLDAVKSLEETSWKSIVGGVQGKVGEFLMTANQSTALSKVEQLQSLLTLENMGIMKGVLSDADIKIITSASTALRRTTTEEAFEKEMKKIRYAAQSMLNSDKIQVGQVLDNGDGTYSYKNMDGTTHTGEMGDGYKDKTIPKLNLDFSQVGGDTNLALPEKVAEADVGDKGGQCGRFVNKATGLGLGDSYQSKISKMDNSINYPEPGMVFVMPYGDTGHTGFVLAVNEDKGTVTVKDSNYSLDEKVKVHEIPINKITGLRRVNTNYA
jgi:hypothetical protein